MATDITPEEIKQIRGKYGLSQQSFARLLGIGEASMVRYENGQVPSKANANLIRAAKHPKFMAECLERDGDMLAPAQRKNVEQVVYAMVEYDREGHAVGMNEMHMLTLEQEILNEKAAELMGEAVRLLAEAERNDDEVGKVLYADVVTLLAQAKGSIIRDVETTHDLACVKGAIEELGHLMRFRAAKAA